ncbi:hypothetical protein CK203_051300 [Vitis vinifera]|uniref:Uncharacterized protein n=1 Tax=Vitis vinifera TaxID=29760 RepID=A0A438H3U9_VITVI|nr:hypothetical protein CK203_051300 [Vitis vinifera]
MTVEVKEPPHLQFDKASDTIKSPDDSVKKGGEWKKTSFSVEGQKHQGATVPLGSPPPHQQPISSITRSRGVQTRGRGAHTRGTRHTSVLRDAPSTDISLPPVQETPITPMEVSSTPPVVPLVASSPPSIEATLVDKELVHIANDDQQGQKTDRGRGRGRRHGHGANGGLHVSLI